MHLRAGSCRDAGGCCRRGRLLLARCGGLRRLPQPLAQSLICRLPASRGCTVHQRRGRCWTSSQNWTRHSGIHWMLCQCILLVHEQRPAAAAALQYQCSAARAAAAQRSICDTTFASADQYSGTPRPPAAPRRAPRRAPGAAAAPRPRCAPPCMLGRLASCRDQAVPPCRHDSPPASVPPCNHVSPLEAIHCTVLSTPHVDCGSVIHTLVRCRRTAGLPSARGCHR